MRIPIVEFHTLPVAQIPENLFNPILHASPDDLIEKFEDECKCGSTDENDYYPANRSKCKYCVRERMIALRRGEVTPVRKRKYATCECGMTGKESFYHSTYRGKEKIQYPCKKCRKKYYEKHNAQKGFKGI